MYFKLSKDFKILKASKQLSFKPNNDFLFDSKKTILHLLLINKQ